MGEDLAALILAGGDSSRLGDFKPTVSLCGRPLIAHALSIARRCAARVYILVRTEAQRSSVEHAVDLGGAMIVLEERGGAFPNPLIRSMRQLGHEIVFLMGCDMPFLDPALPFLLHRKLGDHGAAVPCWPNGFMEPLAALYRRSRLPNSTIPNLRAMVEAMDPALVPLCEIGGDSHSFANINTIKDLRAAARVAQARSTST